MPLCAQLPERTSPTYRSDQDARPVALPRKASMVVNRASCFRRGKRSICSKRRRSLTAGPAWWLDRKRLMDAAILGWAHRAPSETQSHLCAESAACPSRNQKQPPGRTDARAIPAGYSRASCGNRPSAFPVRGSLLRESVFGLRAMTKVSVRVIWKSLLTSKVNYFNFMEASKNRKNPLDRFFEEAGKREEGGESRWRNPQKKRSSG